MGLPQVQRWQNPLPLQYGLYDSPFGDCLIATTEKGICNLYFPDSSDPAIATDFLSSEWGNKVELRHTPDLIKELGDRLFAPDATHANIVDLHLKGTDFQLKVWRALLEIPYGQTTTYQQIAEQIGQPKAVRAVGTAIGRNPVSYVVPCHRVIRTSGAMGGYRWGIERKIAILDWEKKHLNLALCRS
ncbi:methylated-DNA/protein-cysteinemethyltransferase [[Leptolyngbya] sp. PCC 7376]|nr:methylated-DNA/protein-cysteinemethyltransferase [[Leptolyngbya] sp. PCC 7376]